MAGASLSIKVFLLTDHHELRGADAQTGLEHGMHAMEKTTVEAPQGPMHPLQSCAVYTLFSLSFSPFSAFAIIH